MKKSELKQIIKEEVRKVLNENEPPKPAASSNGFNYYNTKEDFEKALDYYWGGEEWEENNFGGKETSYVINNLTIAKWNPNRTHPGAVNIDTGSSK
jgi:hypothetical protein